MNILITGIKGEIGQRLSAELSSRGNAVFGCDLLQSSEESSYTTSVLESSYSYFQCDIAEYRQLSQMFEHLPKIQFVFNCAAGCGRWGGEDFYEPMWTTNVIGLKNILEIQKKLGFKLIHFSTSEIYGDYGGVLTEDITEKYAVHPYSDYAITKYANEMQLKNASKLFGSNNVIVRPFNIFGIGERFSPYRSYISKFIYCCIKNKPFTVYPNHKRSITYLDDAVRAIANIGNNFINGEIYNISGDHYQTVLDTANMIIRLSEANPALMKIEDKYELMTVIDKHADNSKAKRDLGYYDSLPLEDALGITIEWARTVLSKE